jgi:uncharacterized protein YqgC (DUF456 family)
MKWNFRMKPELELAFMAALFAALFLRLIDDLAAAWSFNTIFGDMTGIFGAIAAAIVGTFVAWGIARIRFLNAHPTA